MLSAVPTCEIAGTVSALALAPCSALRGKRESGFICVLQHFHIRCTEETQKAAELLRSRACRTRSRLCAASLEKSFCCRAESRPDTRLALLGIISDLLLPAQAVEWLGTRLLQRLRRQIFQEARSPQYHRSLCACSLISASPWVFCRTSEMSHAHPERGRSFERGCHERKRTDGERWLWRLVGLFCPLSQT
jgi:hypothetical protein